METSPLLIVLTAALCTSAFPSRYRRFVFIDKRMNWTAAQAYCRENHTDLATVYSQEDAEWISNIQNNSPESYAWIGMRRSNSSMKWSNGVSVNYTKNTADDGRKEPFCTSMTANGDWENVNCTLERHFMCYNKGDGDHPLSYTLIKQGSSWCEAQRFCRLHHTDLVSIGSDTQNEAVKEEGSSSAPFWIGLMHTDWEWSDGACSTFRNWATDQPKEGKDCVYMFKEQKTMGVPGCSQNTVGICYKDEIHVIERTKTWEDALDHCNKNYEGFLRIESPQDQRRLEEELHKKNLSGPVWLGLRQSRLFGFWIWANGMNVGWSNWEGGSQPEQPLSHICGAIATSGPGKFKWSDQNCLSKSYFLCEGKKQSL